MVNTAAKIRTLFDTHKSKTAFIVIFALFLGVRSSNLIRNPVRIRSCICSCKCLKSCFHNATAQAGRQSNNRHEPEDLPSNSVKTSDQGRYRQGLRIPLPLHFFPCPCLIYLNVQHMKKGLFMFAALLFEVVYNRKKALVA